MSLPGARGWLAFVVSTAALAGCGQSQDDQVRELVADYHRALSERDEEQTCELLGPSSGAPTGGRCVAYAKERFGEFQDVDLSDLEAAAERGSVTIKDDRATIRYEPDWKLSAIRVGGEWKIDRTGRPSGRPDARALVTPTPTQPPPWKSPRAIRRALAGVYSAFERSRAAGDAFRPPARRARDWERRGYRLYPDQSRLLARVSGYRVYGFPGVFKYTPNLCVALVRGDDTRGLSCGAHTDYADSPQTLSIATPTGSTTVAVFPAGVKSAELEAQDGTVERLKFDDGVALIKSRTRPTTLTWNGQRGSRSRSLE